MTLAFPDRMPPCISLGSGKWETQTPWWFAINGFKTIIPAGFVTDLYSVPWLFSLIIPRDQASNVPALIHDFLYATCGLRMLATDSPRISHRECDRALYRAAEICELSWIQRRLILRGLLIGSWRPWNQMLREGRCLTNPRMK